MKRDTMTYEVCEHCNGSGWTTERGENTAPCRHGCKPLHVVPTGVTIHQQEAYAKRAK